jgi:hypothetical protein
MGKLGDLKRGIMKGKNFKGVVTITTSSEIVVSVGKVTQLTDADPDRVRLTITNLSDIPITVGNTPNIDKKEGSLLIGLGSSLIYTAQQHKNLVIGKLYAYAETGDGKVKVEEEGEM